MRATASDTRSQARNRDLALERLRARLAEGLRVERPRRADEADESRARATPRRQAPAVGPQARPPPARSGRLSDPESGASVGGAQVRRVRRLSAASRSPASARRRRRYPAPQRARESLRSAKLTGRGRRRQGALVRGRRRCCSCSSSTRRSARSCCPGARPRSRHAAVFVGLRGVFNRLARFTHTYEGRDRVMALYAPVGLARAAARVVAPRARRVHRDVPRARRAGFRACVRDERLVDVHARLRPSPRPRHHHPRVLRGGERAGAAGVC